MTRTVLHLSKFYLPRLGGIETAVRNIVENHINDLEHVVLTNSKISKNHQIGGVKVIEKASKILFSQPLSFGYIIWYILNYRRFDIIHLHLPNYVSLLLVFLFRPKKIIVHWHATIESVDKKKPYFLLNYLEKTVLKSSKKIIIGTEKYAKGSKTLDFYSDKHLYIQYGCESQLVNAVSKENILISVGRLVNYKGIIELVNNIIIPEDWVWYIIGDGPLKENILDAIRKKNLEKKVQVISNVDNLELKSYFSRSKILLFPSLTTQESFGITQIEALSVGTVILNFNIPNSGVSEIVDEGKNGFSIELENYHVFNEKLKLITSDEKLLFEMSNNALNSYNDNFTVEVYAEKISKIYSEI